MSMNQRLAQLVARRSALQQRSAQLRNELVGHSAHLMARIGWADRGVALLRSAGNRPLVLAAAVALMWLKPVRAVRWGLRAAAYASLARRAFAAFNAFKR